MAKSKLVYGRGTGKSHPVDVHVGARVRVRRTLQGMTQTGLADALGLTFQQVQKYEHGTNRIGAGRLYDISRALDVPAEYFFEDMPLEAAVQRPAHIEGHGKAKAPSSEPNPMVKRQTLDLVRAYYKIEDADVRKHLREMAKALGVDGT